MKHLFALALALTACSHAPYKFEPALEQIGTKMDAQWIEAVARDHPDARKAAEKASRTVVYCAADLGTDPATGKKRAAILGANLKTMRVLCPSDVRQSAIIHERNHLLLYYLGVDDWRSHNSPLWATWLDGLEIEIRRAE